MIKNIFKQEAVPFSNPVPAADTVKRRTKKIDTDASIISYKKTVKTATIAKGNSLNDLNSKEWVEFTKSWFIENPSSRSKGVALHPAKYPESMVARFLRYFTKNHEKHVVFDPFGGTGSSMVAVDMLNAETGGNRIGYSVELNDNYADIARRRTSQTIITGDVLSIDLNNFPMFDFIMTSPPYWNVLHKDTGHINKKRGDNGLDVVYSASPNDLGNIEDYDKFINILSDLFACFSGHLKNKKFCVVVLSATNRKGRFFPIPYDFARELQKKSALVWKGERIWCQDNKALMPYGYPYSFVPNFTHHTCLIFRKEE